MWQQHVSGSVKHEAGSRQQDSNCSYFGAIDAFAIEAAFGMSFALALAMAFAVRLIAYQLEQAQKVKPNEMIDS